MHLLQEKKRIDSFANVSPFKAQDLLIVLEGQVVALA
jgi:hypothetical protein